MAANKQTRFGPVPIAAAVGNLFNPPTLGGGVNPPAGSAASYFIIRHLRVVNKSAAAVPVSLFIGATGVGAAGTEFAFPAKSIPANDSVDWYGAVRLDIADFLTGLAGTVTTLVISGEGEIGVA